MAAKKKVVEENVVIEEAVVEEVPVKVMAKISNCELLNLRKAQNTTSEILEVLNKNSEIEVVSAKEEWTKVKVNGKSGYVMSKYICQI